MGVEASVIDGCGGDGQKAVDAGDIDA